MEKVACRVTTLMGQSAVSHLDLGCEQGPIEDWNVGSGKRLVRMGYDVSILVHWPSRPIPAMLLQRRDSRPELVLLVMKLVPDHRTSHWATHIDLHVFSGQLEVL